MDKEELDTRLLDQMLVYVAEQKMEEIADECYLEGDVRFTPRFEKRMSRIINRIRRRELAGRAKKAVLKARVLIVIHAVIIGAILIHIGLTCFPGTGISDLARANNGAIYASQSGELPELPRSSHARAFKQPNLFRGQNTPPYIIKSAGEPGKSVLELTGAVVEEIEKVLQSLSNTK
jgi:hypothetical protein